MITIIFGNKGTGKTALNTKFFIDGVDDRDSYVDSCDTIMFLNDIGINIPIPPQEHISYSNFEASDKYGATSYPLNPYHMCTKNNDGIEYDMYFPGARFHIMEGQVYWNSRHRINKYASAFFENSRHAGFDIFIDCQRPKLIDLNIRDITDRFITIIDFSHKYDDSGKILSSKWICLEFPNWSICEKYIDSGDVELGEIVEFTFDGCIFDYYDSTDNLLLFYDYEKDFDLLDWSMVDKFITPPKNYYDK